MRTVLVMLLGNMFRGFNLCRRIQCNVPRFVPKLAVFAGWLMLAAPAFSQFQPPQQPIPGYVVTVAGVKAGKHSFGFKAYNGTFLLPAGELPGSNRFASVWLKKSAYHAGTKVWDIGGFTGAHGTGKGLGDERMEITVQAGLVRVERQNANGLVGQWDGTGLGTALTLAAQGSSCDCSTAVVKVIQVADLRPYMP